MNKDLIIKSVLSGKVALKEPCNLQKNDSEFEFSDFYHNVFLDKYAHGACDSLAFWLHDTYGLKIGAIRAIDMNDENDTDYETVVHQFVYIDDKLTGDRFIIDARGIDYEREMLNYYREASLFDDEDWDFDVDYDYEHLSTKDSNRLYDKLELTDFKDFLGILATEIKSNFSLEKNKDQDSEMTI